MKKIKYFIVCLVMCMFLTACTRSTLEKIEFVNEFPAIFEVGEDYNFENLKINAIYSNGSSHKATVTEKMVSGFDTRTVGKKVLTVSYYGLTVKAEYEVVEKKYLTVSFEGVDEKDQTVHYGEHAVKPNDPVAEEGFVFVGWYVDNQEYDFNTPVYSDTVIVARFDYTLAGILESVKSLGSYIEEKCTLDLYPASSIENIKEAYLDLCDYVEDAKTVEEVKELVTDFYETISKEKDYITLLEESIENYQEEDYLEKDWKKLVEYYQNGVNDVNNYEGGAPTIVQIYHDTLVKMNNVTTKEQDIVIANYLRITKENVMSNKLSAVEKELYSDESLKALEKLVEEFETAINEALYQTEVMDVYLSYDEKVSSFLENNKCVYVSIILEIRAYYTSLGKDNYYSNRWQEIEAIYLEAANELRNLTEGVDKETYLSNVYEKMNKVSTKEADDLILKPYKEECVKNLKAAYDELILDLQEFIEGTGFSEQIYEALDELMQSYYDSILNATTYDDVTAAYENAMENYENQVLDTIMMYA